MKRLKKVLSVFVCLALVIGLLPAMTLTADASSCSSYYFDMKDQDVLVGDEVYLRPSAYTADLATSDYGVKNNYSYEFEDPSMVQIRDGSAVFVKSGKVYLTVTHDQYFERTGKSQRHTHSIVFTVSARKEINPKEITVYSGDFNGGDVFPGFSVSSTAGYEIEEVSFYHEMCDYYPGDKIPLFRSGTEIDNICLKLKPKEGYMFAFSGEADGTTEKSAYSISYRGKTYTADVKKDYDDNSLIAYLTGTVAKGQIYHVTMKDLNIPYHNGSLDKNITVPDYLEPVSVRYTMFGKDLDRLEKGDRIGIIVRLKTKNEKDSFAPSGSIYWDELKKYSTSTKIINSREAEYTFEYTVDIFPDKVIKAANFTVTAPTAGQKPAADATSSVEGIKITSVKWTPADAEFEGGKNYTVRIEFTKEDDFVFADDFKNQPVTVNGVSATLGNISSTGGSKDKFTSSKYYAEAVLKAAGGNNNEVQEFTFVDVPSTQWYYVSVKSAYEMGLINGKSAELYKPGDNMTVAEAVKLAVCMNILYNGGDPNKDIANGTDKWYSTYMKYALDKGIIDSDLTPRANEKITRREYVYIFSKSLPKEAFTEKNNIPSGSIPDVKEEKTAQDKAIYLFYRAGILSGSDSRGTFNPDNNIKRSEVAAILIRMMDETARVGAPADLGK